MVWTQAVARTSVWYGVDSSSEQDVCVVWCGLKLWPGRLCGMEWTQVVARTSVCVDSSCGHNVCVCGFKLWAGRQATRIPFLHTRDTDSGLSRALVSLACTHVTLSANFSLSTIGLNPYYIESESQSEFAPSACCLVMFYGP